MYFLRFTADAERDMQHGCSLWVDWTQDDQDERPDGEGWIWVETFECWCHQHSGLSGHALSAESLEEAIEEVLRGYWFGNPRNDSWAIFEGEYAPVQDTPEGDTFGAERIVFFQEAASAFNTSL